MNTALDTYGESFMFEIVIPQRDREHLIIGGW